MNNELIMNLANKAVGTINFDVQENNEFVLQFAELIIKECASVIDKVYEQSQPDHGCYDWATFADADDIRSHFGISKN